MSLISAWLTGGGQMMDRARESLQVGLLFSYIQGLQGAKLTNAGLTGPRAELTK